MGAGVGAAGGSTMGGGRRDFLGTAMTGSRRRGGGGSGMRAGSGAVATAGGAGAAGTSRTTSGPCTLALSGTSPVVGLRGERKSNSACRSSDSPMPVAMLRRSLVCNPGLSPNHGRGERCMLVIVKPCIIDSSVNRRRRSLHPLLQSARPTASGRRSASGRHGARNPRLTPNPPPSSPRPNHPRIKGREKIPLSPCGRGLGRGGMLAQPDCHPFNECAVVALHNGPAPPTVVNWSSKEGDSFAAIIA